MNERSLVQDLNDLHASFVSSINLAVADNDVALADRLAAEYDTEAIKMIAEREGRTHMLPLVRRGEIADTPLRRLVRKLSSARVAA
ncbi:MAG: hypothetical protein ABWX84_07245 [Nocardioides sp.]